MTTGRTREEVEKNMREAIKFHIDGLREESYKIPESQSYAIYAEVPA